MQQVIEPVNYVALIQTQQGSASIANILRILPPRHIAIIISAMKIIQLHSWQISTAQAQQVQLKLASQVSRRCEINQPCFIAGVDISVSKSTALARAAVVVINYPEFKIIEIEIAEDKLTFPYIPSFLSFREAPLISAACQKLSTSPDLILVDGQGIAHPRRLGLASHLGLLLDVPTIGCAKSRLCGSHEPPQDEAGAYSELTDNGDIIGVALRTKSGAKPIYVSIGHKVDLPSAIYWAMECCQGYRLPEPSRLAHLAAGGKPIITTKIKPSPRMRLST
jgi:deoxyribonuclease V